MKHNETPAAQKLISFFRAEFQEGANLVSLHDTNSILHNTHKYFANAVCCSSLLWESDFFLSHRSRTFCSHALTGIGPKLQLFFPVASSGIASSNHRGKTQLSSLTEIFVKQMKQGSGET